MANYDVSPGWKVLMVEHDINGMVESRANDDNPEFVEFLKKYRESSTSVTVEDVEEGVRFESRA